ncbi:MAG: hypothetical protein IJP62_12365 [Treponema sp.]|nr:hypothetical protein [Treponema sp.]
MKRTIAQILFTAFGTLALLCGATSCEALQDSLSSEQTQKVKEDSGIATYASSVKEWYYNGLATSDMSTSAIKLGDDYYPQSFLLTFGKKIALNGLAGSIELMYTDADGNDATKTFSSISGSFTSDYTGYRIDMSDVLKYFNTVTIPSGTAVMNVKASGFVCAEGSQSGRAITPFEAKGIAIKPLLNETTVDFSIQGYSTTSKIELGLNGAVSFENGTHEVTAKVSTAGEGETQSSYVFTVSAAGNTITFVPKTSTIPADGTKVLVTLKGILPAGCGHSVSQDITLSFSKYKIVIDGKKDANFAANKGATIITDDSEDQNAFAGLGYDVSTQTDLREIAITSDNEYLYIGVSGTLALTWNNPLVIQVSNGKVTGADGAKATVHAADKESYTSVARKTIQPNVYIAHQPGKNDDGTGYCSAYAYVTSNTDITSSIKCAPFGWTQSTIGSFLEYAIPLNATTGLSVGDTVNIIVAASLGWDEGYAVVDACPSSAVTYNDSDHLDVKYNFTNGISYTIPSSN